MNTFAVINIAKSQLGLDDDVYRALLLRVTGEASLRAMSERQRLDVVAELKRKGFKMVSTKKARSLPVSNKRYVKYIHALWRSCANLGVIEDGSRNALRSFVKKRSDVDDPDFLTFDQASPIIDALKAMEARG